jgi:hypothetical protein
MAIVDLKTGRVLSGREIKARTMAATGWTSEEYQKQYDILRNKVRAYEKTTGASVGKVNEFLYKEQAAKARYGAGYKQSALTRAVRETESVSSGAAAQAKAAARLESKARTRIFKDYERLAAKYKPVGELIKDAKANPEKYTAAELRQRLGTAAKELEEYQKTKAQETAGRTGYKSKRQRGSYDAGSTYDETGK